MTAQPESVPTPADQGIVDAAIAAAYWTSRTDDNGTLKVLSEGTIGVAVPWDILRVLNLIESARTVEWIDGTNGYDLQIVTEQARVYKVKVTRPS